jgi:hypothetical protein
MLRRGGRKRASGRRTPGTTSDRDAPDPGLDEEDEFNTEFWTRRLDDPPPDTSPRLETPPPPSRVQPTRAAPVARDKPAARPKVDEARRRGGAELSEVADAIKADLHRAAVRHESAAEARRKEAAGRHEARLAEFADATTAELSGIASRFERAIDARLDEAERHEVKLAELADATRAELSRIAAQFERVAADRIAQVEELSSRVAAQEHAISQRTADLDRREAEFTRRLEEGLERLDSQLSAWRRELTQSRGERGAAVERAAVNRLTELLNRVDEHHRSFGSALAERVEGLENALAEPRRAKARHRTEDIERGTVEDHTREIHWMRPK